jgi:hypothetical protein
MKKILLAFSKGIMIGLVLLPIEFSLLFSLQHKAHAFDWPELRGEDSIVGENDPRDLRDEENRGCCTRNDHEPTPQPSGPPSPSESPGPTPPGPTPPGPTQSPGPQPTASPGVGGVTTETVTEKVTEKETITEYVTIEQAPAVKALAPTSSQ